MLILSNKTTPNILVVVSLVMRITYRSRPQNPSASIVARLRRLGEPFRYGRANVPPRI
jgi:hypothetical protein